MIHIIARALRTPVFLLLVISGPIHSADLLVSFDNPQQRNLYQALLQEYRCLKCQNQNLADSSAGLAEDLRREIREQILAGNNQHEIEVYLVARYGEFVLYRPRFSGKTAVLWIGPFLLLAIGIVSLLMLVRKSATLSAAAIEAREVDFSDSTMEQRLQKANALLEK